MNNKNNTIHVTSSYNIDMPTISPDKMVDLFIEIRRGANMSTIQKEAEIEQMLLDRLHFTLAVPAVEVREVAGQPGGTVFYGEQGDRADAPLSVMIEGGELVMKVGIMRLDGNSDHPSIPILPISDREQWAADVARVLLHDRGDGATPISLCLDAAMSAAIEMGSTAIDHDRLSKATA